MTTSRSRRVPRALAALTLRYPLGVVVAGGLAAVCSILLAVTTLEFRFGHLDLISSGDRYRQLDERDSREFEPVPERVVVVIRAEDPERAKAFATALAARWAHDPKIERVLYRIDLEPLKAKALWYLPPDDLARLRRELAARQELLADLAGTDTLHGLFARINREITSTLVGRVFTAFLEDEETDQAPPDLTLLLSFLRELNRWLEGSRTYRSPWTAALAGHADQRPRDGFLWSDDQRLLFVLADPRANGSEFNRFASAVEEIRADVRALQGVYPGTEVGITGRAVIEADEMGAAQRDMTLATVIATLGVVALFLAFFRGLVRPGRGHHHAGGRPVLVPRLRHAGGRASEHPDHRLHADARRSRRSLHPLHHAVRGGAQGRALPRGGLVRTFAGTGMGIVAAAGTTAFAFSMLLLTGFKGLMELGVISGSGILLTAAATLTVLPALLVLEERGGPPGPRGDSSPGRRGTGWAGCIGIPGSPWPPAGSWPASRRSRSGPFASTSACSSSSAGPSRSSGPSGSPRARNGRSCSTRSWSARWRRSRGRSPPSGPCRRWPRWTASSRYFPRTRTRSGT